MMKFAFVWFLIKILRGEYFKQLLDSNISYQRVFSLYFISINWNPYQYLLPLFYEKIFFIWIVDHAECIPLGVIYLGFSFFLILYYNLVENEEIIWIQSQVVSLSLQQTDFVKCAIF